MSTHTIIHKQWLVLLWALIPPQKDLSLTNCEYLCAWCVVSEIDCVGVIVKMAATGFACVYTEGVGSAHMHVIYFHKLQCNTV